MSVPGNILHLQDEISTGIVSAVTSSLIARKQGLASRLTAKIVAEDAESGLGYRDDLGELTHFVWGERKKESGPYKISYLAYRDREQFLELLAFLKGLGDQIHCVQLVEPAHVQIQDMINEPFRHQKLSKGNEFQEFNKAQA